MENVLKFFSRIEVIIVLAVLIIALIAVLIIRKSKSNKYKKQIADLEVRYNKIKSVPLPYKLNKAVAIARTDDKLLESVTSCKDNFEHAQNNLKQISSLIAQTEDNILVNKNKDTVKNLADLDSMISLGEKQVTELDTFLDTILEKENAQRAEVTELKEQFRLLKNKANEKSASLAFCWPMLERNITNVEKMFSTFEEWMYASEFDKAGQQLQDIKKEIGSIDTVVDTLPELLQEARGVVPTMLDEVKRNIQEKKDANVYLGHLEVDSNINALEESLKADLIHLKEGKAENVKEHLEDYKVRLRQLNESVDNEAEATEQIDQLAAETNKLVDDAENNCEYIKDTLQKVSVRFGLEELETKVEANTQKIEKLKDSREKVNKLLEQKQLPASTILMSLKELNQDTTICSSELGQMRMVLDSAKSDEERAKKQLTKLQLIISEMQVKVRMNKLPAISETYEQDLSKAYDYLNSLERLINETPLNVELLNVTLNDSIDFVSKLFNNVNNIVGMAIMVENTIVFGNKYRSTYPDIDSELTRAELCYRNGEYTQALTIALDTVEKIHPGTYESLIKENAKSAA